MTRCWALLLATASTLVLAIPAGAIVVHQAVLRPGYAKGGLLVVLAIGSDLGPPHRPSDPLRGRADAVQLIAVDTVAKRATIVGFPRDSLVAGAKLNAHLAAGGPQQVEAALESYTGIPVDFWALTTFQGLTNMVDQMGGVDVIVDQPMQDRFSGSNFQPGPQHLAGGQALAYVRDRYSVAGGDIGRSRHQGELLRFAHAQVRARQADLPTLTRLIATLSRNTVTNIPKHELLAMVVLAIQIDPASVAHVPLGGPAGGFVHLQPGPAFDRIRAGQVGP
ncbi:MAG TPA: LCP family protein [Egibacteraceae bacterium]|nr:LCP family protein [Egibacteraceae bacterium]